MILPDRSGIDLILGWTFLLSAGVMQFNRRVLPIYKDPKSEKGMLTSLPISLVLPFRVKSQLADECGEQNSVSAMKSKEDIKPKRGNRRRRSERGRRRTSGVTAAAENVRGVELDDDIDSP